MHIENVEEIALSIIELDKLLERLNNYEKLCVILRCLGIQWQEIEQVGQIYTPGHISKVIKREMRKALNATNTNDK